MALSAIMPSRNPVFAVRRLLVPHAIHNIPTAPPQTDAYRGRLFLRIGGASNDAEDAVVVIVRVVAADDPLGVTDGGANEHCACGGSPEQENATAALKPLRGLR